MSEYVNIYRARFTGRKLGSIGLLDQFLTTVTALNEEEAKLKLYDRFEHITGLTLTVSYVENREKYPEYSATQSNNKNKEN